LYAADVVNVRDEPTKLQGFLPAIRFHATKDKPGTVRMPWGVFPRCVFRGFSPTRWRHVARGRSSDSSVQPVSGFKLALPNGGQGFSPWRQGTP
jgi:hypothetical protein